MAKTGKQRREECREGGMSGDKHFGLTEELVPFEVVGVMKGSLEGWHDLIRAITGLILMVA